MQPTAHEDGFQLSLAIVNAFAEKGNIPAVEEHLQSFLKLYGGAPNAVTYGYMSLIKAYRCAALSSLSCSNSNSHHAPNAVTYGYMTLCKAYRCAGAHLSYLKLNLFLPSNIATYSYMSLIKAYWCGALSSCHVRIQNSFMHPTL